MAGYDDPNVVRSVAAAMLALAWIAVILRTYVRAWMVKAIGLDDYFAIATLVSYSRPENLMNAYVQIADTFQIHQATFTLHCIFVFIGLSHRPTAQDSLLSSTQLVEALKVLYLPVGSSSTSGYHRIDSNLSGGGLHRFHILSARL